MQGPKKLLVFAHRPEAQSFLKNHDLLSIQDITLDIYESKTYYLLICGEGVLNAISKTTAALSRFQEIREVWNLGIAGGIEDRLLKKEHIYQIRTCYGELGGEIQFKSFSSANKNSELDCISSGHRVLDKKKATKLSNFAQIVDRELWGIGHSAREFNIPFYAAKLISDFPQSDGDEICRIVKEEAERFSDLLFRYWISLEEDILPNKPQDSYINNFQEFYFTVAMERKFNNLFETLLNRETFEEVLKSIRENSKYGVIINSKITPKQKTLELISFLKELVSPKLYAIDDQLNNLSRDLKRNGADIFFDPSYEQSTIQLNIKLKNELEKDNFLNSLKRFSFEDLNSIIEGKNLE